MDTTIISSFGSAHQYRGERTRPEEIAGRARDGCDPLLLAHGKAETPRVAGAGAVRVAARDRRAQVIGTSCSRRSWGRGYAPPSRMPRLSNICAKRASRGRWRPRSLRRNRTSSASEGSGTLYSLPVSGCVGKGWAMRARLAAATREHGIRHFQRLEDPLLAQHCPDAGKALRGQPDLLRRGDGQAVGPDEGAASSGRSSASTMDRRVMVCRPFGERLSAVGTTWEPKSWALSR